LCFPSLSAVEFREDKVIRKRTTCIGIRSRWGLVIDSGSRLAVVGSVICAIDVTAGFGAGIFKEDIAMLDIARVLLENILGQAQKELTREP